jgi:hypothetical protein
MIPVILQVLAVGGSIVALGIALITVAYLGYLRQHVQRLRDDVDRLLKELGG